MNSLPPLNWLRSFEAAARLNSFSAASEELNLTPAAISQQIALLEDRLGVTLFHRLPRGVALTDIGRAYAEPIKKSLIDMSDATRGLFGSGEKQVLRVRASISFAALVLSPRLSEFHTQHPDILVELSTTVWADRFEDDEFDLDIRYGYGNWEEDEMVHLDQDSSLVVCHPDFATSFGDQLTIQNMAQSEIVHIVGAEMNWAKMSDVYHLDLKMSPNWIKVDSSLIALQMVSSGRGATMVLEQYAKWHLDNGLLVSPFEYRLANRPSLFAIPYPATKKSEEVRIFCQWLKQATSVKK